VDCVDWESCGVEHVFGGWDGMGMTFSGGGKGGGIDIY